MSWIKPEDAVGIAGRFEKTIETRLVAPVGRAFRIEIRHRSGDAEWTMLLIDFDNNIGAVGYAPSEEAAVAAAAAFFVECIPLYEAKYAKYGRTPLLHLEEDGRFAVTIPPEETYADVSDGNDGTVIDWG